MTGRSVAVTGPNGRLGRALIAELSATGPTPFAWARPDYDLDVPNAAEPLLECDRPDLVIHTAAWTDVDGCARDPGRAHRRNAEAVMELASACRALTTDLILVSTNEVFDGRRTDGQGYREEDETNPINEYGRSKAAGEVHARKAFSDLPERLKVVRTSWLFGPPGNDFPSKILAASDRLPASEALRVVDDEYGSPTFCRDLARAIIALAAAPAGGTFHLTNSGHTSRAGWAAEVLAVEGRHRKIERISQREFARASTPPAWGVLDTTKASDAGIHLPPWEAAVRDYAVGGQPR